MGLILSLRCVPPLPQVPEAPVDKDDFMLVQRRGVRVAPEAASRYLELMKLIRQQHEVAAAVGKRRRGGGFWPQVGRD